MNTASLRRVRLARRGSVSVEYIFLASLLGVGVTMYFTLPSAVGDMMIGAGSNMDRGVVADADRGAPPAAPDYDHGGTPTTSPPSGGGGGDDDDDGWTDDPWTTPPAGNGKGKGNNGHGNNTDGVDSSNPGKGKGGPNGKPDASCPAGGTCVDDEAGGGNGGGATGGGGTTGGTTTAGGTPKGTVATILLTMSDPNIPPWLAATLADNVVRYVSPVKAPRVLVVRDDFTNGEDVEDTPYITGIMKGMMGLSSHDITYMNEPGAGMSFADFEDYDVIWFANPGYPMDDLSTIHALQQAVDAGIGVVLQGDDMSWTKDHKYDSEIEKLTGLDNLNNGTSACGKTIDNNTGGHYAVTFGTDSPILKGLEGVTVLYGNDIDNTTVSGDGTAVYATAGVQGSSCGLNIPVVVASM